MTLTLEIPLLGQRVDPWQSQLINNVKGSTIGLYGCTISCLAMISGRNPGQQESFMRSIGAFTTDLVLWTKTPGFKNRFYCEATPAPIDTIIAEVRSGRPVLVNVHLGLGTPKPNHWVLVVDDQFNIHDPWYNEKASITKRYGKTPAIAILGGAYFNPQTNLIKDDMSQAERDELTHLRMRWAQVKAGKVNEFRRDGEGTTYQIYAIPDPGHFEDLGDNWANVRNIFPDWPIDPKDWGAQRENLRPSLNQVTAERDNTVQLLNVANANTDTLQKQVSDDQAEIERLKKALADANQPVPNPNPDPVTPLPDPGTSHTLEDWLKIIASYLKNLFK